jgi:hypothetical protein
MLSLLCDSVDTNVGLCLQVGFKKISDRESVPAKEDLGFPLLSLEESVGTNMSRAKDSLSRMNERPVFTMHFYWRKFDDAYMRPIFGGPVSTPMDC